jgi:hypothetical protein
VDADESNAFFCVVVSVSEPPQALNAAPTTQTQATFDGIFIRSSPIIKEKIIPFLQSRGDKYTPPPRCAQGGCGGAIGEDHRPPMLSDTEKPSLDIFW